MADPGRKYFKNRLYWRGKAYPCVVWDGVRDYENVPPPELAAAERMCGKVCIMQLGKKPSSLRDTLAALVGPFTSIILWTRDHAVYLATVEEMKAQCDMWLQ